MGGYRCVICGYILDDPAVFPKDFPEKWKLCCNCKRLAENIVRFGFKETTNAFKTAYKWFKDMKDPTENLVKINKLISVV